LDKDVLTGVQNFEQEFGEATSLEVDILSIAASIFAADRGTLRGEREDFSRSFRLEIPIVNVARLMPLAVQIENVLRLLSNDLWIIQFVQANGTVESNNNKPSKPGKVLLFSGGLDSLAAAVELSHEKPSIALVSHTTKNQQTVKAQAALYDALVANGASATHHSFFVSSRDAGSFEHDLENSQRTRSFVFMTLAALTARRLGRRDVVTIAENGQMAIHLPLNSARIGAFSTHTAHPEVLSAMESYLKQALAYELKIWNPYVYKTKKEVIEPIIKSAPQMIALSNSCWKSARLPGSANHCGECIPCYIRRIAIESYQKDPTKYARDMFEQDFANLPPEDEGRRNLADLAEFTLMFEISTHQGLLDVWPELYSVDQKPVIEMYRRGAAETRAVLSKHKVGPVVLS
jgi:7-cyano-7-deazaguanine synthase in queuosine biosynthesis